MGKDLKKFKYDPDSDAFLDIPRTTWEISMVIDKAINVDKVIKFLKANSHWAYLYTKQHQSLRHYFLRGYVMLPFSKVMIGGKKI
jgi:hypothetical protein